MRTVSGRQDSAAAENRYTVPPKDLKMLFWTAERAALHAPNWPDGWPAGRKKWRDDARAQLAEALGKLGWIREADAGEAQW